MTANSQTTIMKNPYLTFHKLVKAQFLELTNQYRNLSRFWGVSHGS